ncbi:amino acid adenylation domain-containing protein [Motilimonas cestriensis]|uniref:Amino acid adenylation domain-containing protein n=1 Tax=Motilimonas cestriensis TaxID=2742685 RepID=A0ABS8WD86_9GAMM|nr:amino acid adenylation domain-containing protein [Motilimonas cestriensis]MCE2597007.1 amino acid adenylation domain-containing protein [Motilimonas cestriensis]
MNPLDDFSPPLSLANKWLSQDSGEASIASRSLAAVFEPLCFVCNQYQVSLETLCLATWGWLQQQYSGETEVTIAVQQGSVTCGLLLSMPTTADQTIASWLQHIQRQWAQAGDENVCQQQGQENDLALCHSLLTFEPLTVKHCAELKAYCQLEQQQLTLQITSSMGLFNGDQLNSMMQAWYQLLAGIAAQDWRSPTDFCLAQWSNLATPIVHKSLNESLLASMTVAAQQNSVALYYNGEAMRYCELLSLVAAQQACLMAHGLQQGDKVGLYLHRGPEMVGCMLACLFSGIAFVPLEPQFPKQRLATIAKEARLNCVWSTTELASCIDFVCPVIPLAPTERVNADATAQGSEMAPDVALTLAEDTLAYMMFTSGSTGKPKGVMINHHALNTFLAAANERLQLDQDTVWLLITTMAFDISMLEIFAPLLAGATLVIANSEENTDPLAICRYLEAPAAQQPIINVLQATPAFWRMLLQVGWRGSAQLTALCGGEALDATLATKLLSRTATLWNCYGPTEATVWSMMREVSHGIDLKIGHSLAGYSHQVLDVNDNPVAMNMVGELCIQGAALSDGYWQRDSLNKEKFVVLAATGGRYYRTGDKVRRLGSDSFQYLGRFDDQVKLRGFRIELGEIEAQLKRLKRVNNAVVKLQGQASEACLVAYIETSGGQPIPRLMIRKELAKWLPKYMLPSKFVFLAQLPKTGSGKIDRKQLNLNLV